MSLELKVHKVIEGPFESPDPEYQYYWSVVLAEYPDGTIHEEEIAALDMDSLYAINKHLSKSIEPFVIKMDEEMGSGIYN